MFWTISFLVLFLAVRLIFADSGSLFALLRSKGEREKNQRVIDVLTEFKECIQAGLIPSEERWEILRSLEEPWGQASETIVGLRKNGCSILPSLDRLLDLAKNQKEFISAAKQKSAQSLHQAVVCTAIVPFFSIFLFLFLPEVKNQWLTWGLVSVAACFVAATGGIWILMMADSAKWAHLRGAHRPWIFVLQMTGERFLAMIRSGVPQDRAWIEVYDSLLKSSNGSTKKLASVWGTSMWKSAKKTADSKGLLEILVTLPAELKRAVQVSLMEGRPCGEHLENSLLSFRKEIYSEVLKELDLLGNRSLKPLFLCVAPAIFSLIGASLYLIWNSQSGY